MNKYIAMLKNMLDTPSFDEWKSVTEVMSIEDVKDHFEDIFIGDDTKEFLVINKGGKLETYIDITDNGRYFIDIEGDWAYIDPNNDKEVTKWLYKLYEWHLWWYNQCQVDSYLLDNVTLMA